MGRKPLWEGAAGAELKLTELCGELCCPLMLQFLQFFFLFPSDFAVHIPKYIYKLILIEQSLPRSFPSQPLALAPARTASLGRV